MSCTTYSFGSSKRDKNALYFWKSKYLSFSNNSLCCCKVATKEKNIKLRILLANLVQHNFLTLIVTVLYLQIVTLEANSLAHSKDKELAKSLEFCYVVLLRNAKIFVWVYHKCCGASQLYFHQIVQVCQF